MPQATEVFSIFGQIEEVAAERMIVLYGCHRIEPAMIPETALFNQHGERARFAIVVPGPLIQEFEGLIAGLRA
jgi:hypothetical protein